MITALRAPQWWHSWQGNQGIWSRRIKAKLAASSGVPKITRYKMPITALRNPRTMGLSIGKSFVICTWKDVPCPRLITRRQSFACCVQRGSDEGYEV